MTSRLITVPIDSNLFEALELINSHRIRHLPVTDGHKLVGIVSDRDLRDAKPSSLGNECNKLMKEIKVKQIMNDNVITAHPLDAIDEAALLLYQNKIGCLPVIKQGSLVGIITQGDVLRAFVELLGFNNPGSSIIIEFVDQPGVIADITKIIKKFGVNINNLFLRKSRDIPGNSILTIRIATMLAEPIVQELKNVGYKVIWP